VDKKNVGEKISHQSAFLVDTQTKNVQKQVVKLIAVVTNLTIPPVYNELSSFL